MSVSRLRIVLWATVAAALAAWGLAWTLGVRDPEPEPFRPAFALQDAEGRAVASEDLQGRLLLVFFGFTNCPDVCPTTLAEVAQVMDDLGPDAAGVQPVFITVDPARDRADLAAYTAAFHPSILGLWGSEAATEAAAKSFRIFYEREDDPAAPDGYTMAHVPGLTLVGPDGDWLRLYDYGTPATEILSDLRSRL